jgi:hypothetical protein
MAGHGFPPKPREERRNKNDIPVRGDWESAGVVGWQFGDAPEPPDGLTAAAVAAWETWFSAWFAAHWTPDDLPGLRQLVRLYDQVERNEFQRASELRLQMDTYGITPKGQQDRRWMRPKVEDAVDGKVLEGRWADLSVVDG